MKVGDAVVGTVLLLLAGAIGVYVSGFPGMPGQRFGAALFPGLIAAGLAACGALLVARGLRQRAAAFAFAPWTRSPPLLSNFLLFCGVLVFYIYAADALGFLIAGSLLLYALFLKLGVPRLTGFVVAIAATAGIDLLFYKFLRVPLPWGLLGFVTAW